MQFLPERDHVTLRSGIGYAMELTVRVFYLSSVTFCALLNRLKFSAMFLRRLVP